MTETLPMGMQPTHPGEILREDVLPSIGVSKAKFANLLGLSRQTLYDILNEKQAITPPVALKLGKLTRTTPSFWLNLQQNHDLQVAEREIAEELENTPELVAA